MKLVTFSFDDGTLYNEKYKRWFESWECAYACGHDGDAFMEADGIDLMLFYDEHPLIKCRESFYDLVYGNTRDEATETMFLLIEYVGNQYREFSFDLENIAIQDVNKYIAAIKNWHYTGEFTIGEFSGPPVYEHWKER